MPEKADVTLSLSDDDFGKMVAGSTQAQRLFMSGKLKVKGDVMKVRPDVRYTGTRMSTSIVWRVGRRRDHRYVDLI